MSTLALARDVDVGAVVLQVVAKKMGRRVNVASRVTDGTLERTLDGASTLTLMLEDSDRELLRSGMFDRQIDLQLDGQWWRLVQVNKAGDQLTLTFEDRIVAYLRQIKTPRKALRSKMTRAEFALSIVREVKAGGGIPFVCPDLHVKQKVAIATANDKLDDTTRTGEAGQGISPGAKLTVKGAPATSEQRGNMQRVIDVAASVNAGTRATMAVIQAVIVESTVRNLNYGDLDSEGILQVRLSTGRNMTPPVNSRDIEQCVHAFLTRGFWGKGSAIQLAAKNPSWSTGQVAQNTQGSGVPGAYDQWKTEAEKWLAAYGGAVGSGLGTFSTTETTKLPYQFQRGGTDGTEENSWACLQRLAQEVGWRCFISDGAVWFIAETTLIKSKPRATLSEDTLGVDVIDFDIDNGKVTSEATVSARAGRHALPPGSVVELEDCGPGDGRWLVHTTGRGIFDAATTVTLKRETKPLPEPAAETTSTTTTGSIGGSSFSAAGGATNEQVDRAYATAQAIHAKRYPYAYGGGHGACGVPSGSPAGLDCSAAVCAVLAGGGMGFRPGGPVMASGALMSWGEAGKGQLLTVYTRPGGHDGHAFIVFHTSKGDEHFGTGTWGKDWGGAGLNPQMHYLESFTARHWPGT